MGHVAPQTILIGVQASVAMRRISATRPSWFIAVAIGLAPRPPLTARIDSSATGTRPAATTPGLSHGRFIGDSEVESEVHPAIERGDFVGVSVEHERGAAGELADPALGSLAPARVV